MTNLLLALSLAVISVSIANKVLADESKKGSATFPTSPTAKTTNRPLALTAECAASASASAIVFSLGDADRKEAWLNEQKKIPFAIEDNNKCAAYLGDMKRRIRRVWFPPTKNNGAAPVVSFILHADGKISNLKLKHSSGHWSADQLAVDAVRNAAPYFSLPIEAPSKINMEVTFGGKFDSRLDVTPRFIDE